MRHTALVLVALCGTAFGDGRDDDFVPAPRFAFAIGGAVHVDDLAGMAQGGYGPVVEGAYGIGRWQLFGEATVQHEDRDSLPGWYGRAGGGIRWLARQMAPIPVGGGELFLEAFAGGERYAWRAGGRLARPDLGAGLGMQWRMWHHHSFTLRVAVRTVFAPSADGAMVACRGGGCAPPANSSSGMAGYAANFEVGW